MAHFGVFCPPLPGHLHPMAVLGRALQERGHRVTVFQLADQRGAVEREGVDFFPLQRDGTSADKLAAAVARMGQLEGLASLRFTIECAGRMAELICLAAPAALRQTGVDAVLVDQNEPAGATVAEHLGLPFISICPSLPVNREPQVPPPFVPWSYRRGIWAAWRNRAAYGFSDRLIAPLHRILNRYRKQWQLTPLRIPDDSFSTLAQLSQLTREFDFPRVSQPDCFHYCGPFREAAGPAVPFPYEQLNGKPLLYASFGTLQNRQEERFRAVAAACADLDAQLILALGPGGSVREASLPGKPIVVPYAPQRALLARASLCITHAGMNTVLDALSYGVPMVALPITHDQPAIAARLARTGAGQVVPFSQLASPRFPAAIRAVLREPRFRQEAQRLQQSIEQAGGVQRAADIVEEVLRTTRPAYSVAHASS